MKILVYHWNNYLSTSLRDICDEMKIDCDYFQWDFANEEYDEAFENYFRKTFDKSKYDFVISINYRPMIAEVCKLYGMKYVSWCCDCPLSLEHPEKTMNYECNYIFLFDKKQVEEFRNAGIERVYHLPLGANLAASKRFKYIPELAQKYTSDVSFVGRLYESQFSMISSLLGADITTVLKELINNQESLYNYDLFDECIDDNFIDYINSMIVKNDIHMPFISKRTLIFALASETTRQNRLILLSLLSKRYSTKLFSTQIFPDIANVQQCGSVMYETEMPYVFHYSKINLNPTLRCIKTGVPLRAFDIMGYGGFLLSNYQEELAEMYTDGREMVLYDSYEDAISKADFYLKNEDLRSSIASAGCARTLSEYTLQKAFAKILSTLEKEKNETIIF